MARAGSERAHGGDVTNTFGNLSALDRAVRILLGGIMLGAGRWVVSEAIWRASLEVFAWVPLLTGGIGWDPIYAILGLRTKRKGAEPAPRGRRSLR